jgi:uncharacterized membrane protein YeaQ/YmgE (transglycosylase-associated protein family)
MSYLLVAVIGVVVGFVTGQYVKGDENAIGFNLAAGAAGAVVAVVLARLVGSEMFAGYVMSTLVAAAGAVGGVFAKRQIMKPKVVPVRARARRS